MVRRFYDRLNGKYEGKEDKDNPNVFVLHFLNSKTTRVGSSPAAMRKAVCVACFISGWKDVVF